jgi:hypothetical protein
VDKELLFKPRLPEDDHEIPGVGTVRVRALSRTEAMHVQAATDTAESDRRIIAQGLVDPALVIPGLLHRQDGKKCEACADAEQWQKASVAGEIEAVSTRIAELSGMLEGADKAAYKSLPDGSDGGV